MHKWAVSFESENPRSEDRYLRLSMDLVTYNVRFVYTFAPAAPDAGADDDDDDNPKPRRPAPALSDRVSTVNMGYLRVLGQLRRYDSTDVHLVPHLAQGLLQELDKDARQRVKISALTQLLRTAQAQALTAAALAHRVELVGRAARRMARWGASYYGTRDNFALRWATQDVGIRTHPEHAALQINTTYGPQDCYNEPDLTHVNFYRPADSTTTAPLCVDEKVSTAYSGKFVAVISP